MATVLVTGANRGIGLQLCKQFAARGDDVIAVCREMSDELSTLDVRVIDGIDVGSGTAVETLRQELDGQSIDILVNNAGILLRDAFGDIDYELMAEQYRINTLGPLRVTEALTDNLQKGSKVAIVSRHLADEPGCPSAKVESIRPDIAAGVAVRRAVSRFLQEEKIWLHRSGFNRRAGPR